MNIGIDIRSTLKKKTGIGYYTLNLINHLAKIDTKNQYFLYSEISPFNKGKKVPPLPGRNFKYLINRLRLPPAWALRNLDVFHTSSYDLCKPKKTRLVLVIHDVIHKAYPLGHTPQTNEKVGESLARILPQADRIIVPSSTTRKDLLRFYDIAQDKIRLVYPGVNQGKLSLNSNYSEDKKVLLKKRYNINGPFILYVGTLEPRKNIEGLIEAYKRLSNDYDIKHQLVITGMKGWLYERIFDLVEKWRLKETVIFTDYVAREELRILYGSADIFVYPSFYEGAGLPILEAFSYGLPVVTSKVSAVAEIAGNAALLIDPYKSEEITQGILKIINSSDTRAKLKQKGLNRAGEFQLNVATKKTLDVFYECVT